MSHGVIIIEYGLLYFVGTRALGLCRVEGASGLTPNAKHLPQCIFRSSSCDSLQAVLEQLKSPLIRLHIDAAGDIYKMAASIKAINAKIRSNKVLDYFCSTRM